MGEGNNFLIFCFILFCSNTLHSDMKNEVEEGDLLVKIILLQLMWVYICFISNLFKMLHLVTEIISVTSEVCLGNYFFFEANKFLRNTMKKLD